MAESEPEFKYGTPQVHLPTCDKHGELIDMVCEDCDEFVCTDCAKSDHKDHNWVTIVKAASQRRRQLHGFIKSIKEVKVPGIDRKIEEASTKMTEMEKQSDKAIDNLRKHFDEIIARLTKIKTCQEKTLIDNLIDKREQVNHLKNQAVEQRKNLMKKVKLMEENNSTMSDYSLIENHRELLKLVSAEDVETKTCEYSLRYTSRDFRDDELDSLMGATFDLDDISATETNLFQYRDDIIQILHAFSENESYVQLYESEYIENVNKQGDKKHKYDISPNGICVTDTGDVYFTDHKNKTIARLSPSGSVSTVVSTHPLGPGGICQSLDGGLLVTLWGTESESENESDSDNSRCLVRHMSLTGDIIREYEYQEDGQTRLFTVPGRVQQNGNSDICVVNWTPRTTGNVLILSLSGRLRCVYHGQNLSKKFYPTDVACDSRCNILVIDGYNSRVHLLSPDGEFLKYLLTENEVSFPFVLSLYGSTLWVGNFEGTVKVYQL